MIRPAKDALLRPGAGPCRTAGPNGETGRLENKPRPPLLISTLVVYRQLSGGQNPMIYPAQSATAGVSVGLANSGPSKSASRQSSDIRAGGSRRCGRARAVADAREKRRPRTEPAALAAAALDHLEPEPERDARRTEAPRQSPRKAPLCAAAPTGILMFAAPAGELAQASPDGRSIAVLPTRRGLPYRRDSMKADLAR